MSLDDLDLILIYRGAIKEKINAALVDLRAILEVHFRKEKILNERQINWICQHMDNILDIKFLGDEEE